MLVPTLVPNMPSPSSGAPAPYLLLRVLAILPLLKPSAPAAPIELVMLPNLVLPYPYADPFARDDLENVRFLCQPPAPAPEAPWFMAGIGVAPI